MDLLYIILLTSIPFLHFFALYYFARKNNRLKFLKQNYALWYTDWLYVPFNILFALIIDVNIILLVSSMLIGFTVNVMLHYNFKKIAVLKNEQQSFFSNNSKFTIEAHIHYIFASIEMGLVLTAFFTPMQSYLYYWLFASVSIYFISWLILMKKIHNGKWDELETTIIILSLLAIFLRLFLFNF